MRMNIKLNLQNSLLVEREGLNALQKLLVESAPKWSRVTTSDSGENVDLAVNGSLLLAVQNSALERGRTYAKLAKEFGEGPKVQPNGVIELRGADDSVKIILTSNAESFVALDKGWRFGNSISLQLDAARIEGQKVEVWACKVFRLLCHILKPAWGSVHTREEYSTKNIDRSDGGIKAIGVDVSRCLPGLYWLNYFGQLYQDVIGVETLATCPAAEVEVMTDGVLIKLSADPSAWYSPEYLAIEEKSRSHLGRQFFFEKKQVEFGSSNQLFGLVRSVN